MSTTLPLEPESFKTGPVILLPSFRLSSRIVVVSEPSSMAAEQYRLLAHSLEREVSRSGNGNTKKAGCAIAISSALAGEGKTITALNLAFALAEHKNRTTCLCDVDLKGGQISGAVGMNDSEGIVEVIEGKRTLAETVLRMDKNLSVLPSGAPRFNSLALLRTPEWKRLVASLKATFDYILLDCPPLCLSDDMTVLDDVIDKTLMVVRSGATTVEALQDALAKTTPAKSLGFVLNDAPLVEKIYRPYKRDF